MKKLTIYPTIPLAFVINDKPTTPQTLGLSNQLCQKIENITHIDDIFSDDFLNLLFDIQEQLPDYSLGMMIHGAWIELAKYAYDIEIIEGFGSGGTFNVGSRDTNPDEYFDDKSMVDFTLDEDFAFPFVVKFLQNHFCSHDQPKDYYHDENGELVLEERTEFDWHDINYYTYEIMDKVLKDIKEGAYLLWHDFDNPTLDELKAYFRKIGFDYLFIKEFYPNLSWKALSEQEQNDFIKHHVYFVIRFYHRFMDKTTNIMNENPNNRFVFFAGP
ncbi:Uncharacterised protein [Moraxella lacunata]|uniref:Uncharacterized protein n=1 Tax=Moraxella lacunata TaxID=477 RepID=A0A378TQ81_MORLA|nr:hypothetical protein [Moraxella lacunata]STZ62877.1 Uncharacterised protein [Moraxella lacunata]